MITASPRRRRDSSSSSTSEVFKQRNCSFIDMDDTTVAFVLNEKCILEEWCDGKLEIKCVREIKLNEDGILHDGEETIPLRSEDGTCRSVVSRRECICEECNDCSREEAGGGGGEKRGRAGMKSSVRMLEDRSWRT